MKSGSLKLENLALDLGVKQGHQEYQRFIILGWARTGSNFLRGLLNSHPQIVAFNEIFRDYNTIDWGLPGYTSNSPKLLSLIQSDPIKFLETQLFRPFPLQILAVGFKIFYYHAQDDGWQAMWPYLRDMKDLRIIHIKRRNLLKTFLSEQRAWKTGSWVDTSGRESNQASVTLDHDECLRQFTTMRDQERKFDDFFENCLKIQVIYEDLAGDYVHEMERVQNFLGVTSETLKPSTFKQRKQPLSQAISNYDELKEAFKNTPWAEFFEE